MQTFASYSALTAALAAGFRFTPAFAPASFVCAKCEETKPFNMDGLTPGYAHDDKDNFICYDCCGKEDAEIMRQNGKHTLYLNRGDDGQFYVTNWPGTLKIKVGAPRKGYHNIARYRYDVWFTWEGSNWHGVQYGDNNTICRVKRVRG